MRGREEHYLAGEAPTKQALSDEERYSKAKTISEILIVGELTQDEKILEDAFVQHDTTLLSLAVPNIEDFKQDFLCFMPCLDGDVKNTLELITLGEV